MESTMENIKYGYSLKIEEEVSLKDFLRANLDNIDEITIKQDGLFFHSDKHKPEIFGDFIKAGEYLIPLENVSYIKLRKD